MELQISKKTALVIESLLNKSKLKNGLAVKFMDKYTVHEMRGKGGLEIVKEFLEKELKEKKLHKTIAKWNIFEDCKRVQGDPSQCG